MHQQHNEYCEKAHSALAGVVWDDELKKLASYKELVNHSNSIIRDRWTKGGENKFGRLFQGFASNEVEGLNVLEWIRKDQVPKDKFVTYPRYTASLRPEKVDNHTESVSPQEVTYYSMMVMSQLIPHQRKQSKRIGTQ